MRLTTCALELLESEESVPTSPKTSLSVLENAKLGNPDAWNCIVDIYGPLVLAQVQRKGLSDSDAKDVTQNVFLSISSSLGAFQRTSPSDSFLRWIRTITSRRVADWYRKNGPAEQGTGGTTFQAILASQPETADDWSPEEWQRQALQRALTLLKTDFQEHTWKAFWLSVVDGLPTKEIASQLEMKPGAVRQARSKVRKRLIEELGEFLDMD